MIFLYTHMQVKPDQEQAFLEVSNTIFHKVRGEEAYKAHYSRKELIEDHDKVLTLLSSPMKAEVFSGGVIELE